MVASFQYRANPHDVVFVLSLSNNGVHSLSSQKLFISGGLYFISTEALYLRGGQCSIICQNALLMKAFTKASNTKPLGNRLLYLCRYTYNLLSLLITLKAFFSVCVCEIVTVITPNALLTVTTWVENTSLCQALCSSGFPIVCETTVNVIDIISG